MPRLVAGDHIRLRALADTTEALPFVPGETYTVLRWFESRFPQHSIVWVEELGDNVAWYLRDFDLVDTCPARVRRFDA